jgi:hypothetical protein
MRYRVLLVLTSIAVIAAALVVVLPANAGTGAEVTTFDPTGAQFACTDATYTAVGGVVQQVLRDSFDANGGEHVTGTITPKGVTLTDGTSLFRLVGASWFGGSFNEATGHFVFTDTGDFNIIAADGTVVGRVSTVEHAGSNGSSFSFDFGNCQPPND